MIPYSTMKKKNTCCILHKHTFSRFSKLLIKNDNNDYIERLDKIERTIKKWSKSKRKDVYLNRIKMIRLSIYVNKKSHEHIIRKTIEKLENNIFI